MLPLSSSPRLRALLISLAIAAALVFYAAMSAVPVLRVSLAPDESPSIVRRKFKPLSDYLEKRIGMKVEFRAMASEAALVDALAADKLDLVLFSGFDLIRAGMRSKGGVVPIAQRAEDAQTRSVFITARRDIAGLRDLRGRAFAFVSETSTSGRLMPLRFLRAAGIDPGDMPRTVYAGTPDKVVAVVAASGSDAGVLSAAAWEKLLADGKVDPKAVHVLYTTPGYPDYNWTVRADMDANLRRKLADAFLALHGSAAQDKEILDLQNASRYIPADAGDYAQIGTLAREAGLLK